jgi:hypothetical protein
MALCRREGTLDLAADVAARRGNPPSPRRAPRRVSALFLPMRQDRNRTIKTCHFSFTNGWEEERNPFCNPGPANGRADLRIGIPANPATANSAPPG